MSHNSHYDRIPKVANFVSLMSALGLVEPLSSWLKGMGVKSSAATVLTLLLALMAAYALEWGIETILSSWPGLRRAVVGSHFIEGTWIDVVLEKGKAKYVGVVHIEYDSDRFRFSGEDTIVRWTTEDLWSLDSDGSFHSEMTVFDWPNLRHKFSGRNSEATGKGFNEGYGEIHFTVREKKPPISYSATFCYLCEGEALEAQGWKLQRNELKELDSPQTRENLLLRYAIHGVINNCAYASRVAFSATP